MAKARKSVGKAKKSKREVIRSTKRGTLKERAQAKSQKRPDRKARPKMRNEGLVAKVTSGVQTVADTLQESNEMARKMGPRGGLSEG